MSTGTDLAAGFAGQQHRQVGGNVLIPIGEGGTVKDHAVVQEGGSPLLDLAQPSQEIRDLLVMEPNDRKILMEFDLARCPKSFAIVVLGAATGIPCEFHLLNPLR